MQRSDWPDITWAAAVFTASSPDAQKRFSCLPGTSRRSRHSARPPAQCPRPVRRPATTQPMITSSRREVSSRLRSRRLRSTWRDEFDRRDLVQGTGRLAAPTGGADVIENEGISHSAASLDREKAEPPDSVLGGESCRVRRLPMREKAGRSWQGSRPTPKQAKRHRNTGSALDAQRKPSPAAPARRARPAGGWSPRDYRRGAGRSA